MTTSDAAGQAGGKEEAPSIAFLDTNILVYATQEQDAHFAKAKALRDRAWADEVPTCLSPQVLSEFFAIVTNRRRVVNPISPSDAIDEIERYFAAPGFFLVYPPTDVTERWLALARQHGLAGADIFDAQLVATMQANGVRRIYTFNTTDFKIFDGIEVVEP